MAQYMKTIENGVREFVTKFPVFSFKMEFSEKYSAILVCYEAASEVTPNDPVWDELITLKTNLESAVGEGNVLFSNGDILFSVSPEATVISKETVTSQKLTFSFVPIIGMNIEFKGTEVTSYNKISTSYCYAA